LVVVAGALSTPFGGVREGRDDSLVSRWLAEAFSELGYRVLVVGGGRDTFRVRVGGVTYVSLGVERPEWLFSLLAGYCSRVDAELIVALDYGGGCLKGSPPQARRVFYATIPDGVITPLHYVASAYADLYAVHSRFIADAVADLPVPARLEGDSRQGFVEATVIPPGVPQAGGFREEDFIHGIPPDRIPVLVYGEARSDAEELFYKYAVDKASTTGRRLLLVLDSNDIVIGDIYKMPLKPGNILKQQNLIVVARPHTLGAPALLAIAHGKPAVLPSTSGATAVAETPTYDAGNMKLLGNPDTLKTALVEAQRVKPQHTTRTWLHVAQELEKP
jgi:hypothetical protein